MDRGYLKLIAGALVIGAVMVFAAVHLIGTETDKGRLAQLADQPPAPVFTPYMPPVPQPIPQAESDPVYEDDGWYDEDNNGEDLAPAPFDPSPQNNDLPPEDLRFAPSPEPGAGQPQMVLPEGAMPMQAPAQ